MPLFEEDEVQGILVIRGGAIGALRLAFPKVRIDVKGDAKRLCLARHPTYVDAIVGAERLDVHPLFSLEPPTSRKLAGYPGRFHLIISYLPASDTTFTDSLKRHCPGQAIS